jgi:hypothetical protein
MDLLLAGVGVLCLVYRRRILELEARLDLCSRQILELRGAQPQLASAAPHDASTASLSGANDPAHASIPTDAAAAQFVPANPPKTTLESVGGSAGNSGMGQRPSSVLARTLMERKDLPERQDRRNERPSIDAYERAEQLLARGLDPKEVSRQTGLSHAELQLIGKVSSRTQ